MNDLSREVVRMSSDVTKLNYVTSSAEADGAVMKALEEKIDYINGNLE